MSCAPDGTPIRRYGNPHSLATSNFSSLGRSAPIHLPRIGFLWYLKCPPGKRERKVGKRFKEKNAVATNAFSTKSASPFSEPKYGTSAIVPLKRRND